MDSACYRKYAASAVCGVNALRVEHEYAVVDMQKHGFCVPSSCQWESVCAEEIEMGFLEF